VLALGDEGGADCGVKMHVLGLRHWCAPSTVALARRPINGELAKAS
jgi:hypothetical protein